MAVDTPQCSKLCEVLICENDQTRSFFHSHDWHVQPDCQRSKVFSRLSGHLGSGSATVSLRVLELAALPVEASYDVSAHFLKVTNFGESVNRFLDSPNVRIRSLTTLPDYSGALEKCLWRKT